MSMKNHGGIISTGENSSDSSTRAPWKSYQHIHLVVNHEELAREMGFAF
jgi:hypothetical protein